MNKIQKYDIHASFLAPAYAMPENINSAFIATQTGYHVNGSISIDVWLVRATPDKAQQSMIESLQKEEKLYTDQLEQTLTEEKPENDFKKSDKVRKLEHGKAVFEQLVNMAQNSVYHKQADKEFLDIARRNFASAAFSQYKIDLDNHLYLAGLSNYEER